ncbi:MAG: hypothetical protein ACTSWY_06165 [Promethearchaeota archaeon]
MVRPPVTEGICLRCKGSRLLCGKSSCPILTKHSIMKNIPFNFEKVRRDKKIFGASPPSVFVGRYGYPNVNLGPMIPIDDIFLRDDVDKTMRDTSILDISELWYGKKIQDIIIYRTSLIRSNFRMNVKSGADLSGVTKLVEDVREKMSLGKRRLLDASQELAMSKRSVDTETTFSKVRLGGMTLDTNAPPAGPSGTTEKIDVIDNIQAHPKVEFVIDDIDLKAEDALFDYLYKTNLSNSGRNINDPGLSRVVTGTEMHRLLSAGLLGRKKDRRLVPTRWSITAVDSIISKKLAKKIRYFPQINQYYTFQRKYLDNNFVILLMPGPWSYEMMEVWNSNTIWTQPISGVQPSIKNKIPKIVQDHETEYGRKKYASNITGAYYAARKEITEFLYRNHRQARCIVFREIQGGYIVPLGVWVIRETVRNALMDGFSGQNVKKIDNLQTALERVNEEFSLPLGHWLQASKLLKYIKKQRRIDEWIRTKRKNI